MNRLTSQDRFYFYASMKKSNLGGARPGAGRPKAGTVKMLVSPKRETAERMRARAKAEGKTVGQLLDATF